MKANMTYMTNKEVTPIADGCPLKQVDECLNILKGYLATNLESAKNVFKICVTVKPDFIFSTTYLKAIVSQHINLFFGFEPPLISYSESEHENGTYFEFNIQCIEHTFARESLFSLAS